jgi:hypothetical protein
MKLFSFICSFLICSSALAQQTAPSAVKTPEKEVLQLKEGGYDFGKILQGRPVTHIFELTNSGTEPLRLENVQASCGCTTPEWSGEPVKPGGSASIKVGYNAAAEGSFQKAVTIYYNGGLTKSLSISGTVYRAPATSAPVNTSIQLLKNQ